jgi:hypothetical protein
MWDPYDTGQPLSQRGSFLEPVIPPTTEICDAPLYCFSINKDWIPLLVGAAMQLAQPSTWKVNNEADRETAIRRATDLCIEIGNAVQCQSAPYVPPGTDTPQAACNIAGYLANSVIRESMNQAINAINENLSILNYGQIIIGAIPGVGEAYTLFAGAILDFLGRITTGNVTDFETALVDNTLWAQVTCAIYTCIETDGMITQANYPCIKNALCSLSYGYTDVTDAICAYFSNLGPDNVIAAQQPGALASYTCTCTGTPAISPPISQITPLVDSGTTNILIAAGESVGTTLITFAKSFGSTPVLTTGTDNTIMIPSVSGPAHDSFTAKVEAPRPVAVDTTVPVNWMASVPGERT